MAISFDTLNHFYDPETNLRQISRAFQSYKYCICFEKFWPGTKRVFTLYSKRAPRAPITIKFLKSNIFYKNQRKNPSNFMFLSYWELFFYRKTRRGLFLDVNVSVSLLSSYHKFTNVRQRYQALFSIT